MKASTILQLPPRLKRRIARVAKKAGRTPHALMIEVLERQMDQEEQVEELVEESLAADRAIDAGEEVYAAADVHSWLERLARRELVARPKPWCE